MTFATLIFLIAALILLLLVLHSGRRSKALPPGPPTIPIIGNIHQIPKSSPHYQFAEWAREYGGIFSLMIGTGTVIVLTDPRLIKELLDKRGPTYNDRATSFVGHDLITSGHHVLLMPYSEKWRRARKLIAQHFNESRVEREHVKLIEAEATQMVYDFMNEPAQLNLHPKRFSNSIIMSLIYGIRTRNTEVNHMLELYDIMERWSAVMETGATPPVDIIPWLKHVPEKVFGNWKTRATAVGKGMEGLYAKLSQRVIDRRSKGINAGCLLDHVLDQEPSMKFGRKELDFFGGTVMEGGSDTTSSMILAFIHAMVKYPMVQKKAHQIIDATLGNRPPTWSDYAQLPYIAQIVKETMRWRPVTPLSVPHATSADDTIDGYFIPKGSIVIINVWGLHNAAVDENRLPPSEFDPERFAGRTKLASEYAVSSDYNARDHYGYGAGRRICPGIHVAERNLFVGIAKLLWAFDFGEIPEFPVDVNPRSGYTEGFLHCAKPFQCSITIREGRQHIIQKEYNVAQPLFQQYEM